MIRMRSIFQRHRRIFSGNFIWARKSPGSRGVLRVDHFEKDLKPRHFRVNKKRPISQSATCCQNMGVSNRRSQWLKFHSPKNHWLVGGLEHEWIMTFHILGISSSQLTNSIFQRGRAQPPTSWKWELKSPFGKKVKKSAMGISILWTTSRDFSPARTEAGFAKGAEGGTMNEVVTQLEREESSHVVYQGMLPWFKLDWLGPGRELLVAKTTRVFNSKIFLPFRCKY